MPFAEIKAIKGVRNDVGPERFAAGDLAYGRNIDIDKTGKAFRRRGASTVAAGAAHSGWSEPGQAYFVQGGLLKRMTPGGAISNVQPATTITGQRVCFASVNGRVYWTDGIASGVLTGGANSPWGLTPPSLIVPTVGNGAMQPGRYLCTMTFVSADGTESGAPAPSTVDVPPGGGSLVFTGLPVSPEPSVTHRNIYVSAPDAQTPMLAAVLNNVTTSLTITDLPITSAAVRTTLMTCAPSGGRLIGHYKGRLYVGVGQFLCYSQPFEYGLFDTRDFIALGADVQTFAAVQDGIFVGTTASTLFLRGDEPEKFELRDVSPYGTVLGTEVPVPSAYFTTDDGNTPPGETVVLWTSQKGVVLGSDGGVARDLTAARYIPPAATVGAALFKQRDEKTPQYLVSLAS